MKKNEIRSIQCQLSVREVSQDAQSGTATIEGKAIVFNSLSEQLDEWGETFRELIKPEACTMEFLNSQDIKLNLLHEREMTIARCNKGQGTMRLTVDETGVSFTAEVSLMSPFVQHAVAMVKDGVFSGCSFEFQPLDYSIENVNGEVIITHTKFARITALTIGMDPAYTATSVNARELRECGDPQKKKDGSCKEEEPKDEEAECKKKAEEEAECKKKAEEEAECKKKAEEAECKKKEEEEREAMRKANARKRELELMNLNAELY